jgi:transcription factor TFIIIB component B''
LLICFSDENVAAAEDEAEEDAMPVPQVKVGPDGSIIIDEATTLIETTAAKRAKEDFMRSPLVSSFKIVK